MDFNPQIVAQYIDKSRKVLISAIGVICLLIFIRSSIHQIIEYKEEIKYLQKSLEYLNSRIDNQSDCDASSYADVLINNKRNELLKILHETELRKSNLIDVKSVPMKNNRYDFALESVGGRVVSYHDTKLMYECSMLYLLSGKCNKIHPPEKAIQRTVEPGEAFCFQGNQGSITIKLSCDIVIDSITIDHVERSMTPKLDFANAPKSISITAMNEKHDLNGHELGNFTFDPNTSNSQTFFIEPSSDKYRYVKINVTQNNGHQNQTCLYRIQVHGFNDEC